MKITLQIFIDDVWLTAAVFSPDTRTIAAGIAGGGTFEYDIDYTVSRMNNLPHWRAGLDYPVTFELFRSSRWPAFLLDILPSGAGRRVWLRRLNLREGAAADWALLCNGAANPPGNLRVAEAAREPGPPHPGFSRDDIIAKQTDFIEYAETCGAVVAGATDVQGDAPKFLLVRDRNMRWHPEGALADGDVLDCWLVKFPRGTHAADRSVLRNEAPYLEVARSFGLRVGAPLQFVDDALFVPRFDRLPDAGRLKRLGLESLMSAAGITEFGRRGDHGVFSRVITRFATEPASELVEYLRRDILNTALRNTDNHGRNSAFLKLTDGSVALSPLFDFAPMFLDPEGIPRSSRWSDELEPAIGRPDWGNICESLADVVAEQEVRAVLKQDAEAVERLPATMRTCGVEDDVIEQLARRCAEIAADLRAVKG
jgi:serine/threonine-protein kinase HipA